jgi:uncharacterized UPF0160 family protein
MKMISGRGVRIAVHSGSFHADDAFAVAALRMYLYMKGNNRIPGGDIIVIRTRDPKKITEADYRVDVGGKYDPETGDFDHHLALDPRENGIPYAAFGLIWKECGEFICGDAEVAKFVEEKLIYSIDSQDNGSIAYLNDTDHAKAFTVSSLIGIFNRQWDDEGSQDSTFAYSEDVARILLKRTISYAKSVVKANTLLREAVAEVGDSPFIVLEHAELPWEETIHEFAPKTLLYVVYPRKTGRWQIKCIEDDSIHRKSLPESWAGLEGEKFATKTGVETAISCHKRRFTAIALNREDAIALVQLAIAN